MLVVISEDREIVFFLAGRYHQPMPISVTECYQMK